MYNHCLFFLSNFAGEYFLRQHNGTISGDGSSGKPWRTLKHAVSRVRANQGHTIQISAGTFIENGPVEIPTGVNIVGAGKNVTIIKAVNLHPFQVAKIQGAHAITCTAP